MILDGYWDKRPSEEMKARILADWSDTLEDWTQPQVLYGLRKWRDENPNKKPNPSHILSILKKTRGEREMKRLRESMPPEPKPQFTAQLTEEERAERKRIAVDILKGTRFETDRSRETEW